MSTESQQPDFPPEAQAARQRTSDAVDERNAEERADIEEDRRRQRELDDSELGGEG